MRHLCGNKACTRDLISRLPCFVPLETMFAPYQSNKACAEAPPLDYSEQQTRVFTLREDCGEAVVTRVKSALTEHEVFS